MNLEEFKLKIYENKIPSAWYAINDGIKFNACILINNNSYWESFYFDEQGESHELRLFCTESEALVYLWGQIERMKRIYNWNPDI